MGFSKAMGAAWQCRRGREQGHDLARYHGCGGIDGPHAAEGIQVSNPRSLNARPCVWSSPTPQKAIAAGSFQNRDGGSLHPILRKITAHPLECSRIVCSGEPTLGAGVE
jgi:hypothetical protein